MPNNFNGRKGETATLLSTGLLNSELRVAGFALSHLNRSTFLGKIQPVTKITLSACNKNNFGGVFVNESFGINIFDSPTKYFKKIFFKFRERVKIPDSNILNSFIVT